MLAGTIAKAFAKDEASEVNLLCIGANAVNQAVKAHALAQRFLDEENIRTKASPVTEDINIEEREVTMVRYSISRDD